MPYIPRAILFCSFNPCIIIFHYGHKFIHSVFTFESTKIKIGIKWWLSSPLNSWCHSCSTCKLKNSIFSTVKSIVVLCFKIFLAVCSPICPTSISLIFIRPHIQPNSIICICFKCWKISPSTLNWMI